MDIDKNSELWLAAVALHELFIHLKAAGFAEEQALTLVAASIKTRAPPANA